MAATSSPAKRGPGRPRKNPIDGATTTQTKNTTASGAVTKRPRGRPARNATQPSAKPTATSAGSRSSNTVRHSPRKAAMAEATAKIEASSPTKRARGRPASTTTTAKSATAKTAPAKSAPAIQKRRGRPPKSNTQEPAKTKEKKPPVQTMNFAHRLNVLAKRVERIETRLTKLEGAGNSSKKSSKNNNGNYEDFEARLSRLEEGADYLTDVEADAVPPGVEEDDGQEEDELMDDGVDGIDGDVVIVPATQNGDAEAAHIGDAIIENDDIPYASPNSDNRPEMVIDEVVVQEIHSADEQDAGPLGPENPSALGVFADIINRWGSPSRQSPARTLA